MRIADYDQALFHTHRSDWDSLLVLMVRTEDQILSKKIEHFLHAYRFEHDYQIVQSQLYALFRYLDHAADQTSEYVSEVPI